MAKLIPHSRTAKALFVFFAIIFIAAAGSMAQSGRNVSKKPQTATAPASVPVSEPTPGVKPPATPLVSVRVIADIQPDNYFAFPKPENMLTWAIDRMRDSSLINVRDGGFENRRDAIKQAEKETDTYIVLLQLESTPGGVQAAGPAAGKVSIYLSILSPGTGKMKYNRRFTLNEEQRDPKIPPPIVRKCYPGIFGNDALLLEAAIKAAEYVMSTFGIPIPPGCQAAGFPI